MPAIVEYPSRPRTAVAAPDAGLGATLILAPGAGATQRHPFMVSMATALAGRGVETCTFDFPYAAAGRRRPDPPAVLEQAWREALGSVRARLSPDRRLFIGGKSMGGRIATQVAAGVGAAGLGVAGVVCLGYPLHPPGRASPRSLAHLAHVAPPILIAQGTRDRFGGPQEVRAATYGIAGVEVIAIEGADHGFAVTRRSGRSASEVIQELVDLVVGWVGGREGSHFP